MLLSPCADILEHSQNTDFLPADKLHRNILTLSSTAGFCERREKRKGGKKRGKIGEKCEKPLPDFFLNTAPVRG